MVRKNNNFPKNLKLSHDFFFIRNFSIEKKNPENDPIKLKFFQLRKILSINFLLLEITVESYFIYRKKLFFIC